MDENAEETNVEWREWRQETFDHAAETGKPVLLALVTQWSAECRAMDASTYTEPRIAANINDGFVPVRVDADRNPRVRDRYNMGGFPSTVFLTPSGKILTGATFLGVDGFRGILDSVRRTWDSKGESAGSVPRAIQEGTPPAGALDARIEEHMVEQLLGAYDDDFGGWGGDVKFPLPRTIEFALVRAPDQATRTLEAIRTHLLDTYDGGFYRYARERNWSGARREKLTDENAALVRAFAYGYRYTGDVAYRETAERGVEYLTTTLWTGDGFAASQGGNERYFHLEPTEREDADPPAVDETVFADRNGLAIDALLRVGAYTDNESAMGYARRAREFVVSELVEDGCVTHYCEPDETDSPRSESGLLLDQAHVLTGLTTSWEVLDEPGPARDVADWTLATLSADGPFHDGLPAGPGLLDRPLFPLDTTVECAHALLDLSLLSGVDRYRERAHDAIASFAGAAERMGVEVAHFASVAARLQEPHAIEVAAPAGSDLHRAALRLADHETVVVPDALAGDREPLCEDPLPQGSARVVGDGTEMGRADTPETLESLLTGTEPTA